jgi:signal transduction histidine kinase/CheY-like chemotaxis protein
MFHRLHVRREDRPSFNVRTPQEPEKPEVHDHARVKADVTADSERRQARETLEEIEVTADSERRQAREDLEEADVSVDSERRRARDFRRVSDREEAAALDRKEQLQAQMHQAQRLENLGQLAGGIAHDFNNLLAVILNYTSFVSEALGADEEADWPSHRESARNDLAQITLAAERAASLTRQLLAFARQEVVRPQVLNLNDVIAGIEEMLRRTLGEHVELITTLTDDLWPVLADPGQLEQVLVNLALNARDAMPDGGVLTIDTGNVEIDAETIAGGSKAREGRNVRLRVSDTGTGMEPEVAEHVFEPFFTTKDIDRGTGLGLSTVYGIITQAEGQIKIYSHVGIGTTFSITLPATSEVKAPAVAPVPYQREPKGETVLIVEDEEALREVTKRILTRNGYRVIAAANGPEALELARDHPGEIHLLVTDVVMPHMLGKEVAEKMQLIKPGIAVLYVSGYARPVLTSQGRLDPNVTLVEKPFSETELLKKAGEVLNGNFSGFRTVAAPSD